jgi:hypothetical protein
MWRWHALVGRRRRAAACRPCCAPAGPQLSANHRVSESKEEQARVIAAGGAGGRSSHSCLIMMDSQQLARKHEPRALVGAVLGRPWGLAGTAATGAWREQARAACPYTRVSQACACPPTRLQPVMDALHTCACPCTCVRAHTQVCVPYPHVCPAGRIRPARYHEDEDPEPAAAELAPQGEPRRRWLALARAS